MFVGALMNVEETRNLTRLVSSNLKLRENGQCSLEAAMTPGVVAAILASLGYFKLGSAQYHHQPFSSSFPKPEMCRAGF